MTKLPTIAEFLSSNVHRPAPPANSMSRLRTSYNGELTIENEFEVQQAIVQSAVQQITNLLQEYEQLVQQELEAARTSSRVVDAAEYKGHLGE